MLCVLLHVMIVRAQKTQMVPGYAIMRNGDTIRGEFRNGNPGGGKNLRIFREGRKMKIEKRDLKEFTVGEDRYVRLGPHRRSSVFLVRRRAGPVNLYEARYGWMMGISDTDPESGSFRKSLRMFCDDYPGFRDTLPSIRKSDVDSFITLYNRWKTANPASRSWFEKNMHRRPLFNFKLSAWLPGAGLEVKLMPFISANVMLKTGFGWSSGEFNADPYLYSQLRYYYNFKSKEGNNRRTYKFNGTYISAGHYYRTTSGDEFVAIEHGWQRTWGKRLYSNISIGGGPAMGRRGFSIIYYNVDFGFNF